MDYQLSITKEEIQKLPLYKFEGEVILVETQAQALESVEKLKGEKILGFDTETRAAFKKGERYDISLIQLATETQAYLFRLNKFPIIKELTDILADPGIVKSGVGLRDDIKGIKKLLPFKESNFVDLAEEAKKKKIKNFGLRALTGIFLRKRLSKKSKISNWERKELTAEQIAYAACDAVVGYQIYKKLCIKVS